MRDFKVELKVLVYYFFLKHDCMVTIHWEW